MSKSYRKVTIEKGNYGYTAEFKVGIQNKNLEFTTPINFCYLDNQLLLVLDKNNEWNPIAGHVEFGETLDDCMIREAQEEGGIQIKPIEQIGFLLIEALPEKRNPKYPEVSCMPIFNSEILEYSEEWVPLETKDRKLTEDSEAMRLLGKRTDSNQMLSIYITSKKLYEKSKSNYSK